MGKAVRFGMDWWSNLNVFLGEGLQAKELTLLQVCLRGLIVFLGTLAIVRVARRRFLARLTPFDTVLAFMLASVLARAINGSSRLWSSLVVGLMLGLLHRLLSNLACRYHRIGIIVKGEPVTLVKDGKTDPDRMRAHSITERDLMEESRLNGRLNDIESMHLATLERNGQISVIPKR